jgi:hypothetical protein
LSAFRCERFPSTAFVSRSLIKLVATMDDQPKEGEGDKKIVHVYPLVKVSFELIARVQVFKNSFVFYFLLNYQSCDKW